MLLHLLKTYLAKYAILFTTISSFIGISVDNLDRVVPKNHWKKKWSYFDLKSWVTGGTKIRPGIPSNSRIFESNWLDILSQFDSNILHYYSESWVEF